MSGGLYPVSNNRASYPANDPSSSYASAPANAPYQYSSYSTARSASFDATHGRPDQPAASSSLSGMFHHAEHDPQQHYSRQPHPADSFSHPHAAAHQRDHVWSYSQPVPDGPPARLGHSSLDVGTSRDYPGPLSHAPPAAGPSHVHHAAPSAPPPSARPPGSSRSRRDKPRLELAPDQPLTTQGKPRVRVYVACVQW